MAIVKMVGNENKEKFYKLKKLFAPESEYLKTYVYGTYGETEVAAYKRAAILKNCTTGARTIYSGYRDKQQAFGSGRYMGERCNIINNMLMGSE